MSPCSMCVVFGISLLRSGKWKKIKVTFYVLLSTSSVYLGHKISYSKCNALNVDKGRNNVASLLMDGKLICF